LGLAPTCRRSGPPVVCFDFASGPFGRVYRFLRILAYLNPMVESRRASRLHVLRTGTIKFVGGGAINCMVRNLSSTGASLEVSDAAGIPERFILVMPGNGLHLACRTVWRKGHGIGVTFG
jgi:hypothetical protein